MFSYVSSAREKNWQTRPTRAANARYKHKQNHIWTVYPNLEARGQPYRGRFLEAGSASGPRAPLGGRGGDYSIVDVSNSAGRNFLRRGPATPPPTVLYAATTCNKWYRGMCPSGWECVPPRSLSLSLSLCECELFGLSRMLLHNRSERERERDEERRERRGRRFV